MAPPLAPCLLGGRTAAVSDPVPPSVRAWRAPRSRTLAGMGRASCSASAPNAAPPRLSCLRHCCPGDSGFSPRELGPAQTPRSGEGWGRERCLPCLQRSREGPAPSVPPAPHTGVRVWSGSQPGGVSAANSPPGPGPLPSRGTRGSLAQTQPFRTTKAWISVCGADRWRGPWPSPRGVGDTEESGALGAPPPPNVWGLFGGCVSPWPAPAQWPPGGKGPAHVRPPFFPPRSHGCENPSWAIPHLSPVFPALRPLSALPGSAGEEAGAPLPEPGAGRSEGRGRRHGGPPSGPQAAAPGREFYFDAMKILFIYNVYIF